jgi:hypothetical protein
LLFPWHDSCSRPLEKPIITHTKLTKELDNLKPRLENVHHTNARHNVHRIEDLGLSWGEPRFLVEGDIKKPTLFSIALSFHFHFLKPMHSTYSIAVKSTSILLWCTFLNHKP